MSRIPAPVDELMWLVAEQNDPSAIDAFGRRYPELRGEMVRRLEMVRGLKQARPARAEGRVPVFQPTIGSARRPWSLPRWATAASACLVLVAVGYASFRVVTGLSERSAPPISEVALPEVVHSHPFESTPAAKTGGLGIAREPDRSTKKAPSDSEALRFHEPITPSGPTEVEVAVRSTKIGLVDALREVERQSGLVLVIGPGLPDDLISIDLSGPALGVLQEMGKTYGFTVFDQGDGTVNVIPAVDEHAAPARDEALKPEPEVGR